MCVCLFLYVMNKLSRIQNFFHYKKYTLLQSNIGYIDYYNFVRIYNVTTF